MKDEFTVSKTETSVAIEKLQKNIHEIQANTGGIGETIAKTEELAPLQSNNLPNDSGNMSQEVAALKAADEQLNHKVEEAASAVTKLKESVQTALKKVKEEFTALKTDTETLHKEVKSI